MKNIVIRNLPIKVNSDITKINQEDFKDSKLNLLKDINQNNSKRYSAGKNVLMNMIYSSPTIIDFINKTENIGKKYELVFPKEALKKIRLGEWKLNKSSSAVDEFTTSIRDLATNKIVKQVKLREIANLEQIDTLLPSLQNLAIQQALMQITNKLESIEAKIDQIHIELNNDRIAKIQAGYSVYLNALQIDDETLRIEHLNLALSKLIDGRAALIETAKQKFIKFSDKEVGILKGIINELLSVNFRGDQKKLLADFSLSLIYIQKSSQIIAEIYYELNQPKALIQSLSPYRDLMEIVCTLKGLKALDDWDRESNWKNEIRGIRRGFRELPDFEQLTNSDYHIEIKSKKLK